MCIGCDGKPTPGQQAALSRRRLLGVAAAGAAGTVAMTALGPAGAAAAHEDGQDRHGGDRRVPVDNISIQLYTLRDLLAADLDGTLGGLAEIGFQKVEHAGVPAGLTVKQFRDKLRSHGLRSTSGHNTPPTTVGAGVPALLSFDPAKWAKVLEDASTLGQKTVNLSVVGFTAYDPATGKLSGLDTAADWLAFCQILNRAGRMAHEAGLGFGLHNHFWEWLPLKDSPKVGSDILIAETDPRYIHFEVDLYWAWYAHRDPVQLVDMLQDRISQFHVKDMRWTSTGGTFTDPGAGIIDFQRIFAAKTASPRATEYIIERDDAGAAALTTARVGFTYLKNIRF